MYFLGRRSVPLLLFWIFTCVGLVHCGGSADPFVLKDPTPPLSPSTGDGSNASSQGACTLQFQAKLVMNLISSVADANFEQQIKGTLPLHVSNNADFVVLGDEFPPIAFTKEENPKLGANGINSITVSGVPGSQGKGTLDGSGNITITGLGLHVSSDPSIFTADLPNLSFTTGTTPSVSGKSKDSPPTKSLSAKGSSLDTSSLKMSLATAIEMPASVPLLGGGAVTAVLDGTGSPGGLDKSPADPACAGTGSGGPPAPSGPSDIVVKQLVGTTEQEIPGNSLNFGDGFVGVKTDLTVRLKNRGVGTLTISGFEKSSDSIPFEVVGADDNPITGSLSVAPGGNRDVKFRFQPTTVTGSEEFFSGSITIHSNDTDQPEVTLFLSGLGFPTGSRILLTVFQSNLAEGGSSYTEQEEVDFGTVYFPNLSISPQRVFKIFRVTNTGSQDLNVKELAPMTSEFTYGTVRLGVNTSKACTGGQDPLKLSDDCSILVTKKFFGSPSEKGVVTLPPADLKNLNQSPHLEILVGFQPVDFNPLDQSTLTVKSDAGLFKTVRLIGHTDSSEQALAKIWVDPTPEDASDVANEVLVENGKVYNFGVFDPTKTAGKIKLRIQNGGGAGGDSLKIVSAGVTISGESNFTLDKSVFDPSLSTTGLPPPSGISDGKRTLALVNFNRPADRREIKSTQVTVQAKSFNPVTLHEITLPPFTFNIVYGLPSGNLTFEVSKMIMGIKSPATAKPISTITENFSAKIPLQIDFNNKGSAKIFGLISRQPNFEDAPDCPGSAGDRKACALGLASFRLPMRLLADNWDDVDAANDQGAHPAGVCAEGNYNGVWQVGSPAECSYMAISLAGGDGTDFHANVAKDSQPSQSNLDVNLVNRKARLTVKGLKIRFLDTEHALMLSGPTGYFDHIMGLTLSTGSITPDLTGLLSETFVPLESTNHTANNINTTPLDAYICDGDGDGDINPNNCTLPLGAPSNTGLLMGSDWNLNTGEMALVGVTKLTNGTRQNSNDDFFDLVNPSPLYVVLKGKICGDSIGLPCD